MHKYMSISILDSDAHILMCVLVGVLVSILCVNRNLQERFKVTLYSRHALC